MIAEFQELSRLWMEQVDAQAEQAELRALAEEIQRDATRRRISLSAMSWFGIGLFAATLMLKPMRMSLALTLALLIAFTVWNLWRDRKVFMAIQALVDYPPRLYPRAAIKRLRTELKLLTLCLWAAVPIGAFVFILAMANRDATGFGAAAWALAGPNWPRLAGFVLGMFVVEAYFIRDRRRMLEQLRRLEATDQELENEDMRDSAHADE